MIELQRKVNPRGIQLGEKLNGINELLPHVMEIRIHREHGQCIGRIETTVGEMLTVYPGQWVLVRGDDVMVYADDVIRAEYTQVRPPKAEAVEPTKAPATVKKAGGTSKGHPQAGQ